jgi:adenylate cyclase
MERKLAAILYADVAGYSRLTGADEEGTHEALRNHRAVLLQAIGAEAGRVCHTAGDAVLAQFGSVVAALKCAIAAQRDLAKRNGVLSENRRLQFRIGVNLGDIIVDGPQIYGNGVNVAARLETLAEPGGICICSRVLEQVEDKLDVGFASLGSQFVKNIKKPVDVYKVLLDSTYAGQVFETDRQPTLQWPRPQFLRRVLLLEQGRRGCGLGRRSLIALPWDVPDIHCLRNPLLRFCLSII